MNTIGRYQLVEKLGQGGMGVVYRGFDPLLQRVVAVKLIGTIEANAEVKERFFREARAAGQLSHKNIITIYDLGEHESQPFLAMEFLEGQDLQQRIAAVPPMSLARKLELAIEICEAIEYAHRHGVVHRDIKPANIFITTGGTAKILDFGLARLITSELTNSNMMMGTLNYMAPEQVRGERADHRSDIFSTGVVLYELFGGKRAFEGDSFGATLYKILQEVPEPLHRIDGNLPAEVIAIVERALEKGREERYQHMSDMLRDLVTYRQLLVVLNSPGLGRPAEPAPADSDAPTMAAIPATPLPLLKPPSGRATARVHTPGSGATTIAPAAAKSRIPIVVAIGALAVAGALVAWTAMNRDATPSSAPQSASTPPAQTAAPPTSPPPSATPPATGASVADASPAPAANPPSSSVDARNVEAARTRMGQAKNAAAAAAAPTLARNTFESAVSAERAAMALSRRGRDADAIAKFSEASGLFRSAEIAAQTEAAARAERSRAAQAEKKPAEAAAPTPPPPVAPSSSSNLPLPSPTLPAAPPTAPPAPAAPATAPTEVKSAPVSPTAGINELLDRYEGALESRNLDALKRLWPSLGGAQQSAIRDEFQNATRIDVEIVNPQINIQGGGATVTFIRRYELHTVDRQRLRRESRTTMQLQRSGTTWLIDRMSFEPVR